MEKNSLKCMNSTLKLHTDEKQKQNQKIIYLFLNDSTRIQLVSENQKRDGINESKRVNVSKVTSKPHSCKNVYLLTVLMLV